MIGGHEIGVAPIGGSPLETLNVDVPFIASTTVVYSLGVQSTEVEVSFISSTTVVRAPVGISSLFYRSESQGGGSSHPTVTVNKPTGSVDGDILVAHVHLYINNETVIPPVVEGGQPWVYRGTSGPDDSGNSVEVYTKRALEEPASEDWTLTTGGSNIGMHVDIVAIGGATSNDIFEAIVLTKDDSPFTDTSSVAGPVVSDDQTALFVAFHSHEFVNTVSMTVDAPYTERADYATGVAQIRHVTATHLGGAVTESSTGTWSSAVTARKSVLIAVHQAEPRVDTNFIASNTVVYTPTIVGTVPVPFISSTTAVYAPTLVDQHIDVPFISSSTVVYDLTVIPTPVNVPFISSTTVVYALTLIDESTVLVPFIPSVTVVYPPLSIFDDGLIGSGTGNGGESFSVLLNGNGDTDTGTLTTNISLTSPTVNLSGDSGLPTTKAFIFEVDGEHILLKKLGTNTYRIMMRALGNTVKATHSIGAVGTWGDSYDMAIESLVNVAEDIEDDGFDYPGWIICFDSTQGYQGSSRYAMYVTNFVGIFPVGGGANKVDSDQPSAVHIGPGLTDDCPSGMTVPALITDAINAGDIAVCRYTNPSGSVLELGARSVAVQSWYGMMRVDDTNVDVTFTDPDGNIVDGTAEEAFVNTEYVTTVLDGDDRVFTYGPPKFSDQGWPIAALAVRHGQRRVPYWESETWRDFSYVYSGFHPDATFVQILVNRNGILFGSVPEVALPGPQDIDGPDAYWDSYIGYNSSTSWYVTIFNGAYIYFGPGLNIPGDPPPPDIIPIVLPPVAGSPPVIIPIDPPIEGGSGGGINPPRGTGGGPLDLSKIRFRGNETAA